MAICNGQEFLAQQLESVLSQLRPEDELIIVDDASTDGSAQLCRSVASQNLRLFSNPQNLGVIASFERGLSLARNDVVFLCDQDDVWLPGKRAAFMSAFTTHPEATVVVSDVEVIDRDGNLVAPSFMATRGGFNGSVPGTLWRNRYLGCAMAVRRSLLRVALPFPKGVPMHDMWLGVVGRVMGRVVYIETPTLRYRRHGNNATPVRSQAPWHRLLRWRVGLLFMLVQRVLLVRLGLGKLAIGTGVDQ